jgi:hypothetical protein
MGAREPFPRKADAGSVSTDASAPDIPASKANHKIFFTNAQTSASECLFRASRREFFSHHRSKYI